MKKTLITTLCAIAFLAAPALAGARTVEFVDTAGTKTVVVFNTDNTATMNGGAPVAYTVDEAAKTVCSIVEGNEVCATFAEMGKGVGFKTTYTSNSGASGTATITAEVE
jgi:hypothetical protein